MRFCPASLPTTTVALPNSRLATKDLHRLLDPRQDLDQVLCWREQRQVSHQPVVNYSRMKLMLQPEGIALRLRGKMVDIYDFPDGRLGFAGKADRCDTVATAGALAAMPLPGAKAPSMFDAIN
jgi:hypothetical protein